MATVSARIRCEIEVEVGNWDGKATFDTLRDQVVREGQNIVNSIFDRRNTLTEKPTGRLIPGTVAVRYVVVAENGR